MTKDDLLSDFIACAEIVFNEPEPTDTVGKLWHGLCVRALSINSNRPDIADPLPSYAWCSDMWEFLWPNEREAFEAESHILYQAVNN